jgi:hypothetical protein
MEPESFYTFIYKTVNAYRKYEEYIEQNLQENYNKNIEEGYLINKQYFDYWKQFTNYDEIKNKIRSRNYNNARDIIIQYRKSNRLKKYQPDAFQYCFNNSEELYNAIKRNGQSYVLINSGFWILICSEKGLKERGLLKYHLGKKKITCYFGINDSCEIITYDNIIDNNKDINIIRKKENNNNFYNKNSNKINYNNNIDNNNYNDKNYIDKKYNDKNYNDKNYNDNNNVINNESKSKEDEQKQELKKILLLYAFEQEMKEKINNLQYKENQFQNYYLISRDWILEYKKHYCYDEIIKMIRNKESLKNLLNNGYDKAKNNMDILLSKIHFSQKSIKAFPENLKNINEFLSERNEIKFDDNKKVSYWKNFEIVNEELKELLSKSELNGYSFDNVSDANCLISCGKVILDISNDELNVNNYVLEIGVINNVDMLYSDEYIFNYDNEEAKDDSLNYFKNDFLTFQKDYINLDVNLECELLSKEGYAYGKAFKIPPHD